MGWMHPVPSIYQQCQGMNRNHPLASNFLQPDSHHKRRDWLIQAGTRKITKQHAVCVSYHSCCQEPDAISRTGLQQSQGSLPGSEHPIPAQSTTTDMENPHDLQTLGRTFLPQFELFSHPCTKTSQAHISRVLINSLLYNNNKLLPQWDETLLARHGVLQTMTDDDDRCQRASLVWISYTMCKWATTNTIVTCKAQNLQ